MISNNTTTIACKDKSITNWWTNSTSNYLIECSWAQYESPTNQDLFTLSTRYHKYNQNWFNTKNNWWLKIIHEFMSMKMKQILHNSLIENFT